MSPGKSILPTFNKPKGAQQQKERRLPGYQFAPNWVRNELLAFIAEFCGTFMFLFMAFAATQIANTTSTSTGSVTSNLLYISLAFGFSLAVNVWAFFRISGGLFNPAVALGLGLIGATTPLRSVVVFIAQIVSSICAAAVVDGLFPGPLAVSTKLGNGTSIAQGVFIEMFLTAELIFVIFMLAAEKHKATYLAPIGIGLALFVSELAGVYFTGGSLNPARSFGPAVIVGFPGYHWIYWIGPGLGTLLALFFYKLMKLSQYETVNPGQDFNEHETEMFDPPPDAITAEEVSRPNAPGEHAAELVESVVSGDTPLSEIRSGSVGRARGISRGSVRPSGSRGRDHILKDKEGVVGSGAANEKSAPEGDAYVPEAASKA